MKYVPADAIERLIAERVKEIGTDEGLVDAIVEEANNGAQTERETIAKKQRLLQGQLGNLLQEIDNWADMIGKGAAKRSGAAEALLEKIGKAQSRRKEVESQLLELEVEEGELKRKVLDAEVMRDSLVKFRDLFDLATPTEKKCLLQLMIHRIIWTPEEIKMALYDRPTDTGRLSGNPSVNRDGGISLECGIWLPMCNPLHNRSLSPAVNRRPSISTGYQRSGRSR